MYICNDLEPKSGNGNGFTSNDPLSTIFVVPLTVDQRSDAMGVAECKQSVTVDKTDTGISSTDGCIYAFDCIKEVVNVKERFTIDAHLIA